MILQTTDTKLKKSQTFRNLYFFQQSKFQILSYFQRFAYSSI